MPYIWPRDPPDLQLRVITALLLLLASKVATLAIPLLFKLVTDSLVGWPEGPPTAGPSWLAWLLAAPVAISWRIASRASLSPRSTQLRDGLFGRVE